MQKPSNLPAFKHTLSTSVTPTPQITGSFAVRGSVASQVNQVVYLGTKQISISTSEYAELKQKSAEYNALVAKIALLEDENQELRGASVKTTTTPQDSNFLADNSWIHALTVREQKLLEPKVMEAVGKLLKLKGTVTYPKERGGAARGPVVWKQEVLIKMGLLTEKELSLIPEWVYLRFDSRLYKALQNTKQAEKKKNAGK